MIDYDISSGVAAVDTAVDELAKTRTGGASSRAVEELEEVVCMETRTLFSRYVDSVLWSGEVDRPTYSVVRAALRKGREAVSTGNTDIARSMRRRLQEFEQFSKKHRMGAGVPA